MIAFPTVPELIKRTKALSALDLILSPEWQYRYYSFNVSWAPSEQMASMRDGCGNEWWILFHSDGWAALKGLNHESQAWSEAGDSLSTEIQAALPPELFGFANEPAFRWDATSFACYYLPTMTRWIRANSSTRFSNLNAGDDDLLKHLIGSASDYANFAQAYYETDVSEEIVDKVFLHSPITEALVSALNPEITLSEIASELFDEIGYPRQ